MQDQTFDRRRRLRIVALPTLLATVLAGCGGDAPELSIPEFVSPEGRQVLLDAQADLLACQSVQATIALSEILTLSDPVGYAASMAGQSAGQGQPDLPADSSLQGMMAIDRICCEQIEKRIDMHSLNYVFPAKRAGRMTDQEFRFWRKLSWYIGSGDQQCRLPDQADPDLGWPSG